MFATLSRVIALLAFLLLGLSALTATRTGIAEATQNPELPTVTLTTWQQASPAVLPTYDEIIVRQSGPGYRESVIVRHSRYRSAISVGSDGVSGFSRRWGDAAPDVQRAVIEAVIDMCRAERLSTLDTAFALALVRHESGFNPDAAAGTSSASGFGQFIDRTRIELCRRARIAHDDPFDLTLNVECLRQALREAFAFAGKRAQRGSTEYYVLAYAYHHDGPALNAGGREIARKKVMPWVEIAQACIE